MRLGYLFAVVAAVTGQTPLQQFTFVPPSSLAGNSGVPYSADEILEHAKPDAAGKPVSGAPHVRHIYRDSQGRTRLETPVLHSKLWVAEIEDPVAGFKMVLDPAARVAHRLKVARSHTYAISSNAADSRPVGSDQALATRIIEGFQAIGTRSVVNLQHGRSTIDSWRIPELSVIVLVQNTLPRSGVFTTRLEHINRAEPDAALFLIPPDYTVIEEKGTFSFTITRP